MSTTCGHQLTKYTNMSTEKDAYHVLYICWYDSNVYTNNNGVYIKVGSIEH